MIKKNALEMDRLALEGTGGFPICRIVVNITSIRVYLYGQLFVMMRRDNFAGVSSWISGGDKYCAAFYLKQGQPIEVELDSREKFDALLAEVDKVLGKE